MTNVELFWYLVITRAIVLVVIGAFKLHRGDDGFPAALGGILFPELIVWLAVGLAALYGPYWLLTRTGEAIAIGAVKTTEKVGKIIKGPIATPDDGALSLTSDATGTLTTPTDDSAATEAV